MYSINSKDGIGAATGQLVRRRTNFVRARSGLKIKTDQFKIVFAET
jgi:hypothetical protein